MPSEIGLFLQLVREQGVGIAALVMVVSAWLKGWVISRATHREIVGMLNDELFRMEEDRNSWRQAWETATNVTIQTQEGLRETQAVAREAVRRVPTRRGRGDDARLAHSRCDGAARKGEHNGTRQLDGTRRVPPRT